MLVIHQAFNLVIDIPSRDSNGRLRSNKRLSGAAPCELEGDFISTYPGLSKDPVQPHGVPGRDIIQRLLALFSQWRRCFGSLVCFQSRLAIRASTNISLVYTDFQFHKRRLISHIPQPERLYHVFLEEYWAFFLRIAHRSQHRYPHRLGPICISYELITGGVPGSLVHSSVINIVTLYLGSRLKAGLITSTSMLNMGSNL